jgi:hypothetical protein
VQYSRAILLGGGRDDQVGQPEMPVLAAGREQPVQRPRRQERGRANSGRIGLGLM